LLCEGESTGGGRKLAAIMFTDMVGYTSLTQKDEVLAIRLLDKQNELVRKALSKYNGFEVKTIGDSFLVEFESTMAAVRCAIEIQEAVIRIQPELEAEFLNKDRNTRGRRPASRV
jgi:class 3 adenylate cyclase